MRDAVRPPHADHWVEYSKRKESVMRIRRHGTIAAVLCMATLLGGRRASEDVVENGTLR
jgi:hypothetical protein